MFEKLKTTHDITTYTLKGKIAEYGRIINNEFYGLRQYHTDDDTSAKLLNIIPEKYRHLYFANIIIINSPLVNPHTDDRRKTAINFYIKTSSGVTSFYEPKITAMLSKKRVAKVFNESDLTLTSSFIANPGDIYLLNTQCIHGVSDVSDNLRIACSIESFTMSYEDTREILKEHMWHARQESNL